MRGAVGQRIVLSAALTAVLTAGLGLGCATVPAGTPAVERALEAEDARVMWIGAHPDDEALAGAILARACIGLGRPCLFLVFNAGGGGECLRPEGCFPNTAEVRRRELRQVAEGYGAELRHYDFYNAPLPMDAFPPREAIRARWESQGDPTELVASAIREFRPTVILTFDPDHGFTGHPEHQLASRYAQAGARVALEKSGHRVDYFFQVLNYFWITRLVGGADPGPPTERFDTHASCGAPRRKCLDVALALTKPHHSQQGDMSTLRSLRPQLGYFYLRRVNPY